MSARDCADGRELLSGFLDGVLSADEQARLRIHLAGCAECRQTLEEFRRIGTLVRAMPPVQPPHHLKEAIFAQTIDAEPSRLRLIGSRMGYSLAAVAAVVLVFVAAIYLLVGGYQRGVTPQVAGSSPVYDQQWPIHRPIEISFNKEMDRDSVISALAIQPAGELDRLAVSWDGNTLVIGGNVQLKPGSIYLIKITSDARDKWGNRLDPEFNLQFTTQSTVALFQTPTPVPTPVPTDVPSVTPTEPANAEKPAPQASATATTPRSTPSATATGETAPQDNRTASVVASPGSGTNQTDATPTRAAATPTPTERDDPPTDLTPEPEQTSTPTPIGPNPTATPTPQPDPTNTPVAPTATPTATATSTPLPTSTPTPTATVAPTETPSPTPTPDVVAVGDTFANLYWGDQTIQSRLGEPIMHEASSGALILGFQRGNMLLREDVGSIHVLVAWGFWSSFPNTATEYPQPQPAPEPDLWIPGGALGALWNAEESVRNDLGYALTETATSFSAPLQEFQGGFMIASPDTIYIIYADGTWEYRPNTGS